jgi:carboxymethylenebutenolidase
MGKMIELVSGDGFKFGAYVAEPAGKPRGALLVIQEIFGVNQHIKAVTDGYAADGYLAIAPALFDRGHKGFEVGYTQADIEAGRATVQKLEWKNTMADVAVTIAHVKHAGRVGITGYCWGGTVSWNAACNADGIACAVPYYGGGIPGMAEQQPKVPVMFHWGETDHSIPMDAVRKIEAAHPECISYVYAAGHGFNCNERGSWDEAAAKTARERTIAFLQKHVG